METIIKQTPIELFEDILTANQINFSNKEEILTQLKRSEKIYIMQAYNYGAEYAYKYANGQCGPCTAEEYYNNFFDK